MAENEEPSTDIFKTIFGRSSQTENAPLPLFADDSFRRKPKPESLQNSLMPKFPPAEKTQFGGSFDSEDSDLKNNVAVETSSKKKDRGKRRTQESESQETKKRKKADGKTEALEKESKKRKRIEIEEEFEAKKYGIVEEEGTEKKVAESRKPVVGEKRKTKDDSVETMVVSEEAYDDENKLQRTIFVGNLPAKVKKKALMKEFKCFGDIESIRIRSVPIVDVSGDSTTFSDR